MATATPSTGDRLAILDLAARYNHLMDWSDVEGWADCLTPNGVFDRGPKLQARGRAKLVAFMQRLIARDRPARHWTNNVLIEGAGDEARLTHALPARRRPDRGGTAPEHLRRLPRRARAHRQGLALRTAHAAPRLRPAP